MPAPHWTAAVVAEVQSTVPYRFVGYFYSPQEDRWDGPFNAVNGGYTMHPDPGPVLASFVKWRLVSGV